MRSSLAVGSLVAIALAVAGCGSTSETQAHFGQICSLGVPDASDPTTVTVNPEAPECASRVCLRPEEEKTAGGTGPLCTAACNVDSDCASGEVRGLAAGDRRCASGFSCRVIVPKLATTPLSCVPVCVCRDFLLTGGTDSRRQSCQSN